MLEDALVHTQRMMRNCTEGALGWPQGASKLTTLFCGQPLANGELLSASMASCHQPHGVNGEEVGLVAGWAPGCSLCWHRTRQRGGKNTLVCEREIMLAPKPIIPKFKKKRKRFFNQTVLLSLNSEWEIVHTAKLAAEARPVKTIREQPSSK